MKKEKLEEFLEHVPKPRIEDVPYEKAFKMTLLNSRKSSWIGIVLIVMPALILLTAILHGFNIHLGVFGLFQWLTKGLSMSSRATIFFILNVCFPVVAIGLNLLSLSFFHYDNKRKEINVTFKIRWWNITITLIAGLLAAFYLFHFVADALAGK